MKKEKVCKISGIGTGVSAAFCFGLISVLSGIAGLGMLVWLDRWGDYLFLPTYSFFAAVFIGSLGDNKGIRFILLTMAALSVAVYFASFGIPQAGLLLGGFLLGGYSFRFLK